MSAKIMPRGWMDKDEPCVGRPKMWRFIYFSFGWAVIALMTFLMLWTSEDGTPSGLRAVFYWVGLAPGAILIGLVVYVRLAQRTDLRGAWSYFSRTVPTSGPAPLMPGWEK